MGQRNSIITPIIGFAGWDVTEAFFEDANGTRIELVRGVFPPPGATLVIRLKRRCAPRCSRCSAIRQKVHEQLGTRSWKDLQWADHPVRIEAAPVRLDCHRCDATVVEYLPWADPFQRQTRRLQHHLALEAASMPVMHVAELHGLSWSTVRRAEGEALARWDATRTEPPLRHVGVDEKYLGRRNKLPYDFVTIVSNIETGEPIWIGPNRSKETLEAWIATLSPEQKNAIDLFAMDMHEPFMSAIRGDPVLKEKPVVHDPFHTMKRSGEAVDEMRRQVFFRAGDDLRGIGRGARWLLLRAWERTSDLERQRISMLLAYNPLLARTYQINEELRTVLHAPSRETMDIGLRRILRRTQSRKHEPLRKLHDSLLAHRDGILALGEHRPATGRIEALNNNWETLVRRARGYRDLQYLLLKLRFMTANPIRSSAGVQRFLALGLPVPQRKKAA